MHSPPLRQRPGFDLESYCAPWAVSDSPNEVEYPTPPLAKHLNPAMIRGKLTLPLRNLVAVNHRDTLQCGSFRRIALVLTIRLSRIGKKKKPYYRVVVIERTRP